MKNQYIQLNLKTNKNKNLFIKPWNNIIQNLPSIIIAGTTC